jgi:hypothetical protein
MEKRSVEQTDMQKWLTSEEVQLRSIRGIYLRAACLLARLPVKSISVLAAGDKKALYSCLGLPRWDWVSTTNEPRTSPDTPVLLSSKKDMAVENLRREVKNALEHLADGDEAKFSFGPTSITVFQVFFERPDAEHPEPGWATAHNGDFRSEFLQRLVYELAGGLDSLQRCPSCTKVFVRVGKRKFCSRRCLEDSKTARYKQSPDHNERKAYMMWRAAFRKASGGFPDRKEISTWLKAHRDKLTKLGRPVSTQVVERLL